MIDAVFVLLRCRIDAFIHAAFTTKLSLEPSKQDITASHFHAFAVPFAAVVAEAAGTDAAAGVVGVAVAGLAVTDAADAAAWAASVAATAFAANTGAIAALIA
jgi:hypothetical protein